MPGFDTFATTADAPRLPPLPWIGLAGPTASGKTATALALAQSWQVEIISVDSALIYRGMDIGSAKPSLEEREAVPHHLIDILDPRQTYSAAQFVHEAQTLIHAIHARGRWPVLVGGTMLYFKALMDGISPLPAANPTVRARLDQEAAQLGWPAMHARLATVDPLTAQRLAPNDAQRIQRALEVWELTGHPLSAHFNPASNACCPPGGDIPPFHSRLAWPPRCLLSLEPRDRHTLHQRIEQRFAAMLTGGLVGEVQSLRARGDLHLGLPSMRCVGYRQVWDALDAQPDETAWTEADRQRLRERGSAATRQLAKRQLTWLRSMPQRTIIPMEDPALHERITEALRLADVSARP